MALGVGLFFVAQVWLAILESRIGPFPSNWFRAAVLVVSVALPAALLGVSALRARRLRMPSAASLVLGGFVLASALWLFWSLHPYHPDHDDTFRAGFVHAILKTGFPPSLRWWSAAASGQVRYYLLTENIAAQMAAVAPHHSIAWLYIHQLKLAFLLCNLLLGFSIARELGVFERLDARRGPAATICEIVVTWAAFLMLIFGATPFELATMHLLGLSQSAIVHTVLLLFLALVLRRRRTDGRERIAIDIAIWTLPALLAAAKLPFLPIFTVALGVHWLLDGELRARRWRALALPAYSAISTFLALRAVGLVGLPKNHQLSTERLTLQPFLLFRELSPQWFHFMSWPVFVRVPLALGLCALPVLVIAWLSIRRHPGTEQLRAARRRALLLAATIMLAGYVAASTIALADREGATELYWLVQGWSALNALVFVAVVGAPASWSKLAIVPFALYAVHANWAALRHAVTEGYPPLDPVAAEACSVVHEWAADGSDRAATVVVDPFTSWDFAACSDLPTMAPPEERYDRFTRTDPLLVPSRQYMQQLLTASPLPEPPPQLRPALGHFAHVLIIRPRNQPLVDASAHLVRERGDLLFYDWPLRR